jgi:hypothetical protein
MCCSLAAAAGGVLPAPPPEVFEAPKFEAPGPLRAVEAVADSGTVHFQARAPPLA